MNGMLGRLDLEEMIKEWSPAEQFLAREVHDLKQKCPACFLKGRAPVILGGGTAVGGGLVVAIAQFIIEKLLRG